MEHLIVLIWVTAVEKVYFYKHTEICWNIDLPLILITYPRQKNIALVFWAVLLKQRNSWTCQHQPAKSTSFLKAPTFGYLKYYDSGFKVLLVIWSILESTKSSMPAITLECTRSRKTSISVLILIYRSE